MNGSIVPSSTQSVVSIVTGSDSIRTSTASSSRAFAVSADDCALSAVCCAVSACASTSLIARTSVVFSSVVSSERSPISALFASACSSTSFIAPTSVVFSSVVRVVISPILLYRSAILFVIAVETSNTPRRSTCNVSPTMTPPSWSFVAIYTGGNAIFVILPVVISLAEAFATDSSEHGLM